MFRCGRNGGVAALLVAAGLLSLVSGSAEAALRVEGQVQAGGGAVAGSAVALWAATAGAPARLTQATTGADGNFVVTVDQTPRGAVLYLVATGGKPDDQQAPATTLPSPCSRCWGAIRRARRHQRDDDRGFGVDKRAVHRRHGDQGSALGLRIAAGNVPNFVDLTTGGWGERHPGSAQQRPDTDDGQFRHLADLLAGCATRVVDDACSKLFAAARRRRAARRPIR